MNPPLIGLSTERLVIQSPIVSVGAKEAYIQAVLRAGGIPALIPVGLSSAQLRNLFGRLDGVVLVGGGDIDPARFDGASHPRVYDVDTARDDLEIELVRLSAESQKPLLGICRGAQVINVALGGTLYTDIADQLTGAFKHDYFPGYPRDTIAHKVKIMADTRLEAITAAGEIQVNSLHHQGLARIAAELRVSAWSPDGLAEAVELLDHRFLVGVQWHPEWLLDHSQHLALFTAFIQAAEAR
ncbi:MAG: gamma-glutamyl-gamma-aminobutyrate hydrolase family protein [Chloroflexota bacterium]|jgi:putative glutamine amidotransferase